MTVLSSSLFLCTPRWVNFKPSPGKWERVSASKPQASLCAVFLPRLLCVAADLCSVRRHRYTRRLRLRGFLQVYGCVPLFYCVLHLYLIHSAALLLSFHEHLGWPYFIRPLTPFTYIAGWGLSLPLVYCVWLGLILPFYLPCWWFGRLKARRRDWWLSYL